MAKFKDLNLLFRKLFSFFGPQGWWPYHKEAKDKTLEICLGAILTQNTAWRNVEKALINLYRNNLLNITSLAKINKRKLGGIIKPVGFFNQKANYIKNFIKYVFKNYQGNFDLWFKKDLKPLRTELLKIKGIGPETADSILLYAASKPIFVVDAYTKRIFVRLGIIASNFSYYQIQKFVHKNLKKDLKTYQEFHALLVKHAKTFCFKKPLCKKCPLKNGCGYRKKLG